MGDGDELHPAVARLVAEHGPEVLDTLVGLPGADLTSLLLAVAERRAGARTPAEVLRQYGRDRFVAPGQVDPLSVQRVEVAALRSVAAQFEPVVLSPVVPLGVHAAIADVDQDNVVTTTRASEVAADPTTALALEAAVRRQERLDVDARSIEVVRLAGVQRVLRAQRFEGSQSFAHFSLLGAVSAGRDRGGRRFEAEELVAHVRAMGDAAKACGASQVEVRLTDFGGLAADVLDHAIRALDEPGTTCELWPGREAARGYYTGVCFKLGVLVDGEPVEIGDGGMVDWTQRLLGNRKERLMTSGLSVERLAMAVG